MSNKILELLKNNPRLEDYYNIGPVQRASVEDFVDAIAKHLGKFDPVCYTEFDDGWVAGMNNAVFILKELGD